MRVLVVTLSYPPRSNPRAFRWSSLAQEFARRGVEVDVLTSLSGDSAREEHSEGVRIFRRGSTLVDQSRRAVAPASDQGVKGTSRGPAGRAIRKLWRWVAWPDGSVLWYPVAAHAARALAARNSYDAIFGVGLPFTAVAVAAAAARRSSGARWVIDLGDPFALLTHEMPPNNLALYQRLNVRVERSFLSTAVALAVTNARTARRYAEAYPEHAAKIHVIPPLLSVDVTPRAIAGRPHKRLVYLGSLYRGVRDPGFLLQLLARALEKLTGGIELHVYGDTSLANDSFLPHRALLGKVVHLHGIVPRARAIEAMQEADVLLNVGNAMPFLLPSKLIEYVASGRPIINIASHPEDSSLAFLREYPAVLTLHSTSAGPSEEQLDAFCRFISAPHPTLSRAIVEPLLAPHRVGTIAERYLALAMPACR